MSRVVIIDGSYTVELGTKVENYREVLSYMAECAADSDLNNVVDLIEEAMSGLDDE